jgi:hypothetical protein
MGRNLAGWRFLVGLLAGRGAWGAARIGMGQMVFALPFR